MESQTKSCQNCKKEFTIESEDFDFYTKIKVPAPTFCPECRLQRRLAFFNLIHLYKNTCGLCKKDTISVYSPDSGYIVYCPKCWWSDRWDPLSYGREYDFSRNFFEQFNELMHEVPHLALTIEPSASETSPFTNYAGSLKNCYLAFNAERNENVVNGGYIFDSHTILDSSLVMNSERSYDSMHIYKVNNGIGLRNQVTESFDVSFLRDCVNCQNCFGSANLRNKKYYFFNQLLSKDDYKKRLEEIDLGSYKTYQEIKTKTQEHWDSLPHKSSYIDMSVNCTGNLIFESKNCKNSFEILHCQNSRYISMLRNTKDSYDITSWSDIELSYDSLAVGQFAHNVKFSAIGAINGSDMDYSFLTINGVGFFGCVSIKKGKYCILNKAYSKDEFFEMRKKIIEHMQSNIYHDSRGLSYAYGEFFPIEFSPWTYNDTVAQRIFPLTEIQAKEKGYGWIDKKDTGYAITKEVADIPDHIRDIPDSFVKEVFCCASCGKGYKVTSMEVTLLRNMNLPFPRTCPFCRIEEKLDIWFSESKLMKKLCNLCDKEIHTPSSLKDKKIIYCEACYQKEII